MACIDPAQLSQVESLCEVLYNSGNERDRQNAQQQLLSLQSSAEYIPQCQYILDNSHSSYALFVASSALTRLITQYWNNFSVPQRVDIRNYILGYLAANGPQLPDFVAVSLIQLVSEGGSGSCLYPILYMVYLFNSTLSSPRLAGLSDYQTWLVR